MHKTLRLIALILSFAVLLAAVGCAGGNSASSSNSLPLATSTGTVQVTVGDSPSDRIVSFSLSFDSVTLASSSGSSVSVLAAPVRFEMTSLVGTTTPVGTLTIPQGTYTSVSIVVSAPQITMVDPSTGMTVQKNQTGSFTVTLPLNPALTIDATTSSLNLDLSLANSIAIDASGNVTFNPRFVAAHHKLGPGQPDGPDLERMIGIVSSTSGSSFVVTTAFGQRTLTFQTDTSTIFTGISGVSAMNQGMVLAIQAKIQSDGSLLATKVVRILDALPTTVSVRGRVLSVTNPLTTFQMVLHDGIMKGLTTSPMNGGLSVTVNTLTLYNIDADGLDLTPATLGFQPTFTAATLSPAQAVRVDTAVPLGPAGMMGGMTTVASLTATGVQLEQGALFGTITAVNGNQITVGMDPTSAFTKLTGASSLVVYKETATKVGSTVNLAVGQTIAARGLLFNDGGTYRLVAGAIVTP